MFFCHSTNELHNFLYIDKWVIVGSLEPLHGKVMFGSPWLP
jgi:hypothetical protein